MLGGSFCLSKSQGQWIQKIHIVKSLLHSLKLNSSHSQVLWGGIFWYSLMWPSTRQGQFSLVQECYDTFAIMEFKLCHLNPGRTIRPKTGWYHFSTFQIFLFNEFVHYETFFGGRYWSYSPIQQLDLVLIEPILH
jgi:hypothetical protein